MKKDDVISNGVEEAKVEWAVDYEVGILLHSGEKAILDTRVEHPWRITRESPLVYQTSVDHMTDDQLRASIEELRRNRISRPVATRLKSATKREPALTAQDKQLSTVLKSKTPEQILELKRKLGLID